MSQAMLDSSWKVTQGPKLVQHKVLARKPAPVSITKLCKIVTTATHVSY